MLIPGSRYPRVLSHRSCSSCDFRVKIRDSRAGPPPRVLTAFHRRGVKGAIAHYCLRLSSIRLKPRADGGDSRVAHQTCDFNSRKPPAPPPPTHPLPRPARPPFTPSDLAASGDSEGGRPSPARLQTALCRGAVHSCRRAVSQSPGQTPVTVSVGFTAELRKKKSLLFQFFICNFYCPWRTQRETRINQHLSFADISV